MRLIDNIQITSIVQTEVLVLREDPRVEIEFRALPADFDDTTEMELPTPRAPRKGFLKDERGRLLKDDANKPIPEYDEDDESYRRKKQAVGKLQTIRTVVHGLMPGQIEFAANKDELGPPGYYRAVLDEMTAFGFGMGDLLKMVRCIGQLSGLSEEDLETAELGFSKAEDSDSASSSSGSSTDG